MSPEDQISILQESLGSYSYQDFYYFLEDFASDQRQSEYTPHLSHSFRLMICLMGAEFWSKLANLESLAPWQIELVFTLVNRDEVLSREGVQDLLSNV